VPRDRQEESVLRRDEVVVVVVAHVVGYVHTGRSHFAEGLRQNPDDWRLRLILEVLDRGRERAPSTPAD
jgi:hypothetical protein